MSNQVESRFDGVAKTDIVRTLVREKDWWHKTNSEIAKLCSRESGQDIAPGSVHDAIGSRKTRFYAEGEPSFDAASVFLAICRQDINFAHYVLNRYYDDWLAAKRNAKPSFEDPSRNT